MPKRSSVVYLDHEYDDYIRGLNFTQNEGSGWSCWP